MALHRLIKQAVGISTDEVTSAGNQQVKHINNPNLHDQPIFITNPNLYNKPKHLSGTKIETLLNLMCITY